MPIRQRALGTPHGVEPWTIFGKIPDTGQILLLRSPAETLDLSMLRMGGFYGIIPMLVETRPWLNG